MKGYVMKIRLNGKDHDLSGVRVVLPDLADAGTENPPRTFPFKRPHVGKQAHRSAAEEWQPHRTQGDRSAEWWNLTAAVRDPAGTRYFLSWTVTHPGRRHLGQLPPQVIAQIKPGLGLHACRFVLISYQASIRQEDVPAVFVMNEHDAWDEEASTLYLRDARHEHEYAWSFDGERMILAVCSPTLAVNLKIQGDSQVMWADDLPGAKGLVQDRADGGHSFSYSLPHLRIAGSITYADERGTLTAVDVSGSGWADRQWGDFAAGQAW
jgi:predicted secreted hydrolase